MLLETKPSPSRLGAAPPGLAVPGPTAGAILLGVGFTRVVIDVAAHRVVAQVVLVDVVHILHYRFSEQGAT